MIEDIIEWILENQNAYTNVNGDLQLDITDVSELTMIRERIIDMFEVDSESEEFDSFWESRIEKDLGFMIEVVFPIEA